MVKEGLDVFLKGLDLLRRNEREHAHGPVVAIESLPIATVYVDEALGSADGVDATDASKPVYSSAWIFTNDGTEPYQIMIS